MGKWRYSSTILDVCIRWREVVRFTSRSLNPWEKAPVAHSIKGWQGLRAVLDTAEKRKFSCPYQKSNLGRPAHNLSPDDWIITVWDVNYRSFIRCFAAGKEASGFRLISVLFQDGWWVSCPKPGESSVTGRGMPLVCSLAVETLLNSISDL
jgi:hypothetical protein